MRCSNCQHPYGEFNSDEKFFNLLTAVNEKLRDNLFILLYKGSNEYCFERRVYKCSMCGGVYKLDVPDQAYRGGWFKIEHDCKVLKII